MTTARIPLTTTTTTEDDNKNASSNIIIITLVGVVIEKRLAKTQGGAFGMRDRGERKYSPVLGMSVVSNLFLLNQSLYYSALRSGSIFSDVKNSQLVISLI
jgi:hypothetical protein